MCLQRRHTAELNHLQGELLRLQKKLLRLQVELHRSVLLLSAPCVVFSYQIDYRRCWLFLFECMYPDNVSSVTAPVCSAFNVCELLQRQLQDSQMESDDLQKKLVYSQRKWQGLVDTSGLLQKDFERLKQQLSDVRTQASLLAHRTQWSPQTYLIASILLCRVKSRERELNRQCLLTRSGLGAQSSLAASTLMHCLTSVVLHSP